MKNILLIVFLLSLASPSYAVLPDTLLSNGNSQSDIEGVWKLIAGDDEIYFAITHEAGNIYSGKTIYFNNGRPASSSDIGAISFDNPIFKMVTNPQRGITFEGILDNSGSKITGYLIFNSSQKYDCHLQRPMGTQAELISSFLKSKVNSDYKTIEQLPRLIEDNNDVLNPLYKYGSQISEPELEQDDILAVINRWHGDIFPDHTFRSSALMLAYQLDPLTEEIIEIWRELIKDTDSTEEKIRRINNWTCENLAYTQADSQFINLPGRDPWGTSPDGINPTFKKLIPSEMKAMSLYTNRISGKCFSLVNLICNCFIGMGVDQQDIVVLIKKSGPARHAMALIKFENEVLLVNLMMIDLLKNIAGSNSGTHIITGIYNSCYSTPTDFAIYPADIEKILSIEKISLYEHFMDQFGLYTTAKSCCIIDSALLHHRDKLYDLIFENDGQSNCTALARYAFQSLRVKHPEYYLKASIRTSSVRELAKKLRDPVQVISWIEKHVRQGSIFSDSDERIMTADEVIVFQQGDYKDKAALAYALLKLNGFSPIIEISADNAFIILESKIYDFKNKSLISSIEDEILLEIN